MRLKKISLPLTILILALMTVMASSCTSHKINIEEFTIVYAHNDGDAVAKASLDMSNTFGNVLIDSLSSEMREKEILVGNTGRSESIAAAADLLYLDYTVKYTDDKVVICGGSDTATVNAVNYFINNCVTEDGVNITDHTYKHEYAVESVTVSGNKIKSFNVISTSADGSYDEYIMRFSETFTERTGYHKNEHADALNIMIKCDSTLAPDTYLIKVATGDITISGANTYGINAAMDCFFDTVLVSNTVLSDGDEFTGKLAEQTVTHYNYINARAPLKNTYCKLNTEKKLNIVYFGGSVTSGYGSSDAETNSFRALCSDWFDNTFPDAEISHYNSAIGGSGSMLGAFRCLHDVNSLDPDLVFIEFAVNDVYCGTDTEDIKMYYESVIRQIKEKKPDCDIVVLYTTEQSSTRNNNNGYFDQALSGEAVAQHYNIPSIYIGGALCSTFDYTNDEEWSKYFIDIVHPTDDGYAVYFDALREFLESELIYGDAYSTEIAFSELPERLSAKEFTPQFILPSQMEITENVNWAVSDTPYWSSPNPYEGYLYPTDTDNRLTIKFKGNNAALFAEYGSDNRIVYSFDGGNERIQNQKGNHPLLLNYSIDKETDEHTLTLSVNIKDESTPYIVSALLVW